MAKPMSLNPSAIIIFKGAIISLIQNILEFQNIFLLIQVCNISAVTGHISPLEVSCSVTFYRWQMHTR